MRRYQEGGAVNEIIDSVKPTPMEDMQESLYGKIQMRKEEALGILRQNREEIEARKESASQQAEQDRWLALAQGMLAPTKTGGFGESLGTSAGLIRGANQQSQQTQMSLEDSLREARMAEIEAGKTEIEQDMELADLLDSEEGMAELHGAIQTVVHPDDLEKGVDDQRLVLAAARKDGNTVYLMDPENPDEYMESVDKLDPARQEALRRAYVQADSEESRSQGQITDALAVRGLFEEVQRAGEILLLPQVTTSGINKWKTAAANFLGVDFGDTVELTELQGLLARDFLTRLSALKGSTSDKELSVIEGISAGIGINANANWTKLKRMEEVMQRITKKGIREAHQRGDMDSVRDLGWNPDLPVITSAEQFNELPVGAEFYEEVGGSLFRKDPAESLEEATE